MLSLLTCITCIIYAKAKKTHAFKSVSIISLVLITVCLVSLAIKPSNIMFIIYLVIYAVGMTLITLTADNIIVNTSNHLYVRFHKPEYHLFIETLLEITRIFGYTILLAVGIVGNKSLLSVILIFSIVPLTMLVVIVNKAKEKYLD